MKESSEKNDRIEVLGIDIRWKLRRSDTVDRYCVMTATMPPGSEVPPHQHPQQEAFFIIEGHPKFAVDNGAGLAWQEVGPGDFVNVPSDALHGFRNDSDRNVMVLVTCEGELGKFFEEAGTPLTEHESPGPVTPEAVHRVLDIARKHGQRFAAPT